MIRPAQRDGKRAPEAPEEKARSGEARPVAAPAQAEVLRLQQGIGNAAVARILARTPEAPAVQKPEGESAAPEPAPSADAKPVGGPAPGGKAESVEDLVKAAEEAFGGKDFLKAAELYERAYKARPLPALIYNVGVCFNKVGRHLEAARAFERYLADEPAAPDAEATRKLVRKLRAQVDAAAPKSAPGPDDDPPVTNTGVTGAQDWFDRAYAHYQAGRYEKAAKAFHEAYKLYPQATFIYNVAAAWHKLGRAEEAIEAYTRYLAEAPDAKDRDKVREAIRKLREGKAPAQQPQTGQGAQPPDDKEPPVTNTGVTGAQDWFDRAYAHYQAGRFEKARLAFLEAYKLYPHGGFLYNVAACLEQLGRKAEAADMYARYLAETPDALDREKTLARIARLRGQTPDKDQPANQEKPAADKPATGTPTGTGKPGADPQANKEAAREAFDGAQEAFQKGDFEKALAGFKQAYALYPVPDFVFNQATALEKLRRPAAAANALEHYLVLNSSAKDAATVIERIKQLRGEAAHEDALMDPGEDEAAAPAVTGKGMDAAQAWFERGKVAYMLGDYDRSAQLFLNAFDAKPLPNLIFNHASALDRAGRRSEAIKAYERYLSLDPTASDSGRVRKRITLLQGDDKPEPRRGPNP
jgi:tetratricopeptide (TPR) repeat protein